MVNNIIYIFIYFSLVFILLFRFQKQAVAGQYDFFMRLNSLRGIFALEIIIGHCTRYESTLLSPLGNFMLISVGFFFFVSGFGLIRSYYEKPHYLNSFLKHRILHLALIAFIALFFTTVIAYISPYTTDFASIPLSVKAIVLRTNWYIRELLIFYILFYVTYRFTQKHQLALILILQILVCIPLYFTGHTRCWFASLICFPLGIFAYIYFDTLTSFLCSVKGAILAVLIFLIGTALSLPNYALAFGITFEVAELFSACFNNIMCIGFMLILSLILCKCNYNNPILSFFTKISTELYLFQFVLISITEKMQLSVLLRIAFVLGIDLIISISLHHLIFKRLK